jgi:uncharacterized membrane protein
MNIHKDISDLIKADIISPETAQKILDYYKNKGGSPTNRLFVVFGILGAVLVGLGIILIIAHNWDDLSRGTKTIFAFLPLLMGQIICGYALAKRQDSMAWRESGSTFLFFAVGACIALVSQIYHIPGGTGTFLFTWMWLCLPLVYVMRSSFTSLLFIAGITYFAAHVGYGSHPSIEPYFYWLLLLGVLPHYYHLYRNKPESNFLIFHHWFIPLSVIISLGTVAKSTEEFMFIAYMSLFGLFYLLGQTDFFSHQKPLNNGYKISGSLGTIFLLLALSFDGFWEELRSKDFLFNDMIAAPEFYASVILSLWAGALFYVQQKNKSLPDIKPIAPVFILFIITFFIGLFSPLAVVMINIIVFFMGILTIIDGIRHTHLGTLNLGLLVITALVVCRFFDTNLSFVLRGLMFVTVGVAFFAANYWLLKKRTTNE